MRYIIILITGIFMSSGYCYAQVEKEIDTTAISKEEKDILEDSATGWRFGEIGGITFNQAGFKNWAPGGSNSFSFLFNARFSADFKKKNHLMQLWATGEYGIQFTKGDPYKVRKNADSWEMFVKYGYRIYKPLYFAVYSDVRSQFSKSYKYTDRAKYVISRFASPIIFEAAIGIDYAPNKYFSLFTCPLATKVTYVADTAIARSKTYGNIYPSKIKKEFGAVLIATYKQDFWKQNISINSVFKVYKNYLRAIADPFDPSLARESKTHYRRNIDIDWQTTIGLKVNKFISANVFMHMVWDNDITFPIEGSSTLRTSKLQFRDIIGVGLTYQSNWQKTKGQKVKHL